MAEMQSGCDFYMGYVLGGENICDLLKAMAWMKIFPGWAFIRPVLSFLCLAGCTPLHAWHGYLHSANFIFSFPQILLQCNFESCFLPLFAPVKLGVVNVYGRQTGERARTCLRGIHLGKKSRSDSQTALCWISLMVHWIYLVYVHRVGFACCLCQGRGGLYMALLRHRYLLRNELSGSGVE